MFRHSLFPQEALHADPEQKLDCSTVRRPYIAAAAAPPTCPQKKVTINYSSHFYFLVLTRFFLYNDRSLLTLLRRGSSKSGDGRKVKKKMEDVNLKLYLENRSIIEENQRLREKASLLRLQNQMLLSQLQHKHHFDAEGVRLGSVASTAAAVELGAVSRGRHCRQTDRSHDVNQ